MAINWPRLLARAAIPYATSTDGNNLSVHCPFCGAVDQAMHMTISVQGRGWHCWRNNTHRGRNPIRLIMRLLKCSFEEAQSIAGIRSTQFGAPTDMLAVVRKGVLSQPAAPAVTQLQLPQQFHPLKSTGSGRIFWEYLRGRDYTAAQIAWLTRRYRLHYALEGEWRYRLIIPIYNDEGALVTWTARAVSQGSTLRYKTLAMNAQPQPAAAAPSSCLLGVEWLTHGMNARALVICEGPLDALRISTLGYEAGVFGTCLFGLNMSTAQVGLIARLAEQYRHSYLLLDPDAKFKSPTLLRRLSHLPIQLLRCPVGVEDPGALPQSAKEWVHNLGEARYASEERSRSVFGSANARLDSEHRP